MYRPSSRRSRAIVSSKPEDIGGNGYCVWNVNRVPVGTLLSIKLVGYEVMLLVTIALRE